MPTLDSVYHWFLSNLTFNLVWIIVVPIMARAWLFFFGRPLGGWRRQSAFWLLAIVSVFIIASMGRSVFNVGVEELPRLTATIEVVNIATFPSPEGKPQFCVLPAVSIQNTGAPSVAKGFSMIARLPGGIVKQGTRYAFPAALQLQFSEGQEIVTPEQAIDYKASVQPIPKGGVVRGRALFVFPDLTQDQVKNTLGITFELRFQDAWGTPVVASTQIEGYSETLLQVPGLGQLVVQPSPPQVNANSSNSNSSSIKNANSNHK